MADKNIQSRLKTTNILLFLMPLIIALFATYLKMSLSYQPQPELYEMNETMRILQYVLYLSGLAVFFFIDGLLQIIRTRILIKKCESSAIIFNIVALGVLNYTAVAGFLGFIISGNISWVVIFCAISFFSGIRFLPLKRNLQRFSSMLEQS
ncbi:MAG: hypothetical protein NC831_08280 [Candidatus Omnitrophica bacterium]|nr:hypothetical protein [Candidatus Omnitrophota bacterium]MCM8828957.1 hypothetical protein [Candidatus Omnitrophota bacterium]